MSASRYLLTDVSNVSILAVPLHADEISNQDRYKFGDFCWEPPSVQEALSRQAPVQSQKKAFKAKRWKGLANALSRRRLDKASNLGASQEPDRHLRRDTNPKPIQQPIQTVLGVSMSEEIEYSHAAVCFHNGNGMMLAHGYVPLHRGEAGSFLIEKGMLCRPNPIYHFSIGSRTNF